MQPGAQAPDGDVLFEDAACGLMVTRENGEVLRANATFCNALGYAQAELVGRRFQDFLTIGGKIFHQTHWLPLMRMQGSVREVKLELLDGGKRRVVMLVNGVRREGEGGPFHLLAFFEMADRARYEREILQARKAAEEALQARARVEDALRQAKAELQGAYERAHERALLAEQVVAIASHDLKTPLSAILMASDLLRRSPVGTREQTLADVIAQSAKRADRLIRDFLDLTLIRVGQGINISPMQADLHEVAQGCLAELRVAYPKAIIEHHVQGHGLCLFDCDRVRQVIGNLVANSVAYGEQGRPVRVTTTVTAQRLAITVHNWGAPIPAAAFPTLFDALSRGSQGGDIRSVGLGLFIVRGIARAHGGEVTVASDETAGTTFTVELPSKGHQAPAD